LEKEKGREKVSLKVKERETVFQEVRKNQKKEKGGGEKKEREGGKNFYRTRRGKDRSSLGIQQ